MVNVGRTVFCQFSLWGHQGTSLPNVFCLCPWPALLHGGCLFQAQCVHTEPRGGPFSGQKRGEEGEDILEEEEDREKAMPPGTFPLHFILIPSPLKGSDIKAILVLWASPVKLSSNTRLQGSVLSPLRAWVTHLHASLLLTGLLTPA